MRKLYIVLVVTLYSFPVSAQTYDCFLWTEPGLNADICQIASRYTDWFRIEKIETDLSTGQLLIHPVGGWAFVTKRIDTLTPQPYFLNNPAVCTGADSYVLTDDIGYEAKESLLRAAFNRKAEVQLFVQQGPRQTVCKLGNRPVIKQVLVRYSD